MSIRKREWTTATGETREAWQIAYTDATGKRRTETFVSQKEAKDRHAEITVELKKGSHTPKSTSPTVAEAGAQWLTALDARDPPLERVTTEEYTRQLKLHIVPFIGTVRLASLTAPMVANWEDRLRAAGRSAITVRIVRRALSMLLGHSMRRGLVNRNVVREAGRDPDGGGRHEKVLTVGIDIPTSDEIKRLIPMLQGRWRPLILTAIFTGLRASELRGLRWSDIENAELNVRQRADRHHKIGKPKSHAGTRTVPLTPMVKNTLREWKLACPKGALDLVFPTTIGTIESIGNIVERGLKPAWVAAGVIDESGAAKYTGMHSLRHFYASRCINRKVDGGLELPHKVVQTRLGHSTLAMTMDTYGHLFKSGDDSAAEAEAEEVFFAVSANAT
jgi:integrase